MNLSERSRSLPDVRQSSNRDFQFLRIAVTDHEGATKSAETCKNIADIVRKIVILFFATFGEFFDIVSVVDRSQTSGGFASS